MFICTHPKTEPDELKEILTKHGAIVLSLPMIEITPLPFHLNKDIEAYNWIVFTSKNSINPFLSKYPSPKNKIAAIGKQTTKKLNQFNIEANFTGNGKSAKDFIREFLPQLKKGENILLVLGNLAPGTLEQTFSAKTIVERINVYQTTNATCINQKTLKLIVADQYDAIIATSPSAYKQLCRSIKEPHQKLRTFSIGETTTAAIIKNSEKPLATSEDQSYEGLSNIIINYFRNKNKNEYYELSNYKT